MGYNNCKILLYICFKIFNFFKYLVFINKKLVKKESRSDIQKGRFPSQLSFNKSIKKAHFHSQYPCKFIIPLLITQHCDNKLQTSA